MTNQLTLREAADLFLSGQPCPSTERQYRFILDRFQCLCGARGITHLSKVTTAEVLSYKTSQAHHAPATRTHRVAVVRSFLGSAERAGWIKRSPAAHIRLETPRKHRTSSLSLEQQRALIGAAATPRDRILVTLLLATGARIGELCGAQVGDWSGRELRLEGKGQLERFVPVPSEVALLLNAYLAGHGPDSPLISGRQGGLTTRQAENIFAACCKHAGLPHLGPHQARHAAAMRWQAAHVPIQVISALLGHSRVSTTVDFYLHASQQLMEDAVSRDPLLAA